MSRAFVNENAIVDDVPDRPLSTNPNYVTAKGLAQIEAALDSARARYSEAQATGSRDALAQCVRDVRYWSARRANAQLVVPSSDKDTVQFGSIVTIVRDDGREQTFQIVGEDEADPTNGTISYVSPLAMSLLRKTIGDTVSAGNSDAEIVAIR